MANHPLFTTRREHIIALAARYAVPTMYALREFGSAGGLITYGPDLPEVYRLTGGYALAFSKARGRPTCRCCCRPSSR